MPNASKTDLNEVDQTFSPAPVPLGISGVLGVFKRGPINDPSIVISSWTQFSKIFGGLAQGSDDALLTKRALERGSQLRVVNIRHYTTISDATSLTATKAIIATHKIGSLAGPLVTLNLYTLTINTVVISQVYTVSSDNTQALLAAKVAQTIPAIVSKAVYLGGNKILFVPATGVTLAVAGAVTLGGSQAAFTATSLTNIVGSTGATLFTLSPKYGGADYNNLQVDILPASNGVANSFDLNIEHLLEPQLNESYKNLSIPGSPTVLQSNYLVNIVNGSQLMNVVYSDLSGLAAPVRPNNTYLKYDTGTDGGAVADTDFTGDSAAKTGVYALDPYGDMLRFGSVNLNTVAVMQGFAAYAENRKDLVAYLHIDNSYVTEAQVTAFRDSTLIDSTYARFFAGGVKILDSFTQQIRGISEMGDALGAAAYSATNFGPWFSWAGPKRGTILNALGVVNNFGLDSNYAGRNLLATHQVCLAITKDGKNQFSGNFTAQLDNSTLSFANVRDMLLYLKKLLAPIFNGYIEEPNDPITWKQIYNKAKPVLEKLKKNRGIKKWSYQGDQFVSDVDQCVINDPIDVDNGKYLVQLYIVDVVSLQLIQVNITLVDSTVSFEDNLSSVGNSNN